MINCKFCSDTGVVLYNKTINDKEYVYAAKCICSKSNNFNYDGTKVEDTKNKSDYYIPKVSEIDLDKCKILN